MSFSGVSCFVGYLSQNNDGYFKAELSSDGGSTWTDKKTFSPRNTSGNAYSTIKQLYTGLPYGDYKVRMTLLYNGTDTNIEYFGYTTYIIQRPSTQYYQQATAVKTITDVPPMTTLITGSVTTQNSTSNVFWNNSRHALEDADDGTIFEFRFYGSKCWVNLYWHSNSDVDGNILIDGVTTNVLNTTLNTDVGAIGPAITSWIRLDDGGLSEGWHTIKITCTTVPASQGFNVAGFGFYSGDTATDTTVKRSLICGKDSYVVGIDESGFTFTGAGWVGNQDALPSFLRRQNYTTTNTDYVEYTTPNDTNLKAIYVIKEIAVANGNCEITLAGGSNRFLNQKSANYTQGSGIFLLYDKIADGIDLHNKVLRITKTDGTNMQIGGLIFEIGDPVELDYIRCMPKFTRYNASSSADGKSGVSISQRLDVYGQSDDKREGRKPIVHTGWLYGGTGSAFFRHGLGIDLNNVKFQSLLSAIPSNNYAKTNSSSLTDFVIRTGDMGMGSVFESDGGFPWFKMNIQPNRVI
jgi:hypothetical protein